MRLFFALWPDEAMRGRLRAATQELRAALADARWVAPENWHLTLAFLGHVADASVASVSSAALEVARQVRSGAITVRLDQAELWAKPHLLCASARCVSPAAEALAVALRDALIAASFAPDLKPFRAHVTLARKVRRAPRALTLTAITWTFDAFALIESRTAATGSLYSVRESWPLDNG